MLIDQLVPPFVVLRITPEVKPPTAKPIFASIKYTEFNHSVVLLVCVIQSTPALVVLIIVPF